VALLVAGVGCKRESPPAPTTGDKVSRIAFASFGPDVAADNAIQGYLDGLRAEGFEQGRNLEVLKSHASGDLAQLPQLMRALDARGLDLIVQRRVVINRDVARAFGVVCPPGLDAEVPK
jgi:putative ABC transport system substrate-binding protein